MAESHGPAREDPRYASLEVQGQLVIYDQENHNAWVQSTIGVELPLP